MSKTYKYFFRIVIISYLLLLHIILLSCSTASPKHPIPTEEGFLNKQILIRAPSYANKFKTTETLVLELKYNSTNVIVFPRNYNLRIFEYSGDDWVEIKEKPTQRFPDEDIIFSPDKYIPAVQVVGLFPDLPDIFREYKLRIYLTGKMKTDDGDQDVTAFVDVVLTP
jgi:hypothetical protein